MFAQRRSVINVRVAYHFLPANIVGAHSARRIVYQASNRRERSDKLKTVAWTVPREVIGNIPGLSYGVQYTDDTNILAVTPRMSLPSMSHTTARCIELAEQLHHTVSDALAQTKNCIIKWSSIGTIAIQRGAIVKCKRVPDLSDLRNHKRLFRFSFLGEANGDRTCEHSSFELR